MQISQSVIPIALDSNDDTPLYQQLASAYKAAINGGLLRAGDPVESTRALATTLGVSRFTVNKCFDLLISQGFVETSPRKRMKVARLETESATESGETLPIIVSDQLPTSKYHQRLVRLNVKQHEAAIPLTCQAEFPSKLWRQCISKNLQSESEWLQLFHPEPLGAIKFRQAIAAYLARSRQIRCAADQIVIFNGITSIVDLISLLTIEEGDTVCIGDPSLQSMRRVFKSHGAELFTCTVDEDGMQVEKLIDDGPAVSAVYLMPSHHNPSGAALSPTRRFNILNYANRTNTLILEDDFDCHFCYASKPLPALKSVDNHDTVVYMSDFGSLLYPAVSIGYAIFPERLMPAVSSFKNSLAYDLPRLDQLALADFIEEGYLEQHIRKLRPIYAARRARLILALTRQFGASVEIPKESAGHCLQVRFLINIDDEAILTFATAASLKLFSSKTHYLGSHRPKGEFLIPFSTLNENEIDSCVLKLAQAMIKQPIA